MSLAGAGGQVNVTAEVRELVARRRVARADSEYHIVTSFRADVLVWGVSRFGQFAEDALVASRGNVGARYKQRYHDLWAQMGIN